MLNANFDMNRPPDPLLLFTPGAIGRLELPNRLIRSATHEGMADEAGRPTEAQAALYEELARGGVGLIITGYVGVHASGKSALHRMAMIDSDALVPAHRRLVERVHAAGGRIALQLAHCGRQTWSGVTGQPLLAPSAVACSVTRERPRAMSEADIAMVVQAFDEAARRAREAGYDAVQVHAAHGYLLSSFLSRRTNRRRDAYGGTPEKRFRVVAEVLRAVRDAVGPEIPVLIKLNTLERARAGIRPAECVRYAEMVEATGCCDAIELSGGTNEEAFVMSRGDFPAATILRSLQPYCDYPPAVKAILRRVAFPAIRRLQPPFSEGYNLQTAAAVKAAVGLPVITVGGMRSGRFIEDAIASGKTDFVSLARPLVREPNLPARLREDPAAIALCRSCNLCLVRAGAGPLRCYQRK